MKRKVLLILVAIAALCAALTLAGCAEKEVEISKIVTYSPGEYIVTNLARNPGDTVTHLARVTIMLEIDNEAYLTALLEKDSEMQPRIRDAIVFVLRNMTSDEITADDANNQSSLRTLVLTAVNDSMRGQITSDRDSDHFIGVVFSDFVIQ
jgi:flagellar basal body-associated protein FliL